MIEFLLLLPTWLGFATAMVITAMVGLVVYLVSHKLISNYQSYDLKDPTSSLFRVVGLLVSLMLALAFSAVVFHFGRHRRAFR